MKIEQVEPRLAHELDSTLKHALRDNQYAIPDHYQPRVSLLDANGRKKKSNASADKWSWESGRIEIRFEPLQPRPAESSEIGVSETSEVFSTTRNLENTANKPARSGTYIHPAEADLLKILVKALDRAESSRGWKFVPLKKFRDEILSSEDTPSMRTDVERQNVLRSAIEKRLVLVGKVPNPKAPEFPVTTIRLNRLMPEVQRALGQSENHELDFHPVEIRGEPLSATILRERR